MKPSTGNRIPSLPKKWENFFLSILLHLLLPLLPLVLELWETQTVSDQTVTLAASMYTITIGLSSRNIALFGLAIPLSIILAVAFGFAASEGKSLTGSGVIAIAVIMLVFGLHACERYNRHIADSRPFLRFGNDESD